MLKLTDDFYHWIMREHIIALQDQIEQDIERARGRPHYLYLAEATKIPKSELPDIYDYVIKVGEAENIENYKKGFGLRFQILGSAAIPTERLAKKIEKRFTIDYEYGEDVPRYLHEYIKPHSIAECRMCTIEDYNDMVDSLNRFFDSDPFPRHTRKTRND